MEICYLLAFPDTAEGGAPPPEQFNGLIKDAPYFQPVDIDLVTLGDETILIEAMPFLCRAIATMTASKWWNAASTCPIPSRLLSYQ